MDTSKSRYGEGGSAPASRALAFSGEILGERASVVDGSRFLHNGHGLGEHLRVALLRGQDLDETLSGRRLGVLQSVHDNERALSLSDVAAEVLLLGLVSAHEVQ